MTQEIQKTPQKAAEEFVELIAFLNKPSQTPLEEGIGMRIISLAGGGVPAELATVIKDRTENSLRPLTITHSFKEHIQELVQKYSESGVIRMTGTRFITDQCGIDLAVPRYGIFDSHEAREVEREAIRLNYPPRSEFIDTVIKHNQKMDNWVQEYIQAYHEDPLQSS